MRNMWLVAVRAGMMVTACILFSLYVGLMIQLALASIVLTPCRVLRHASDVLRGRDG